MPMTVHVFHADVHAVGLVDDCPRCEELAEDPLASLDEDLLVDLEQRIAEGRRPRSFAEGRAMQRLQEIAR